MVRIRAGWAGCQDGRCIVELLRGVVHGKLIELETEPGLPDGQPVTVVVQPDRCVEASPEDASAGAGLRRAFGAWADDAQDLDEYVEWNRRQRKISRRETEP